ncbi:alpha/beta fold hydrolase [Streptomyces sp. WMMC1477]|uniref:alpha/beta fold hydrolase n=1 Tax=Streptomyces sp. WMMC1477 TaxID=3015155 RepID=UPI0022B6CF20|nr:alpha/beta hydrolase [Streptomyces sp. WMMC1477]MCZ7433505.1 alpha/beta hydrolase [Streptomyces sp. WMMC1477]
MSKPPFLKLPPGGRAYRLHTSRGAFAVHDAGTPRLGTALLLPGFTGSKEDFVALLGPLADAGFRVVAVDGLGQYESDGPADEDAYALPELAADVLAQAEALGAGPLHLLGHSLGGLIARAAVLRDAAPFRSLTLMSSGPEATSPLQQDRVRMLTEALRTFTMAEVWEHMRALDPPEAADAATPPEVEEFLRDRWLTTAPAQLVATGRILTGEPDRVAELAAVPLPRHVVSGATDYAWPVPLLADMARRLDAPHTVIDGADHSPNADRPTETAAALARFWAAH